MKKILILLSFVLFSLKGKTQELETLDKTSLWDNIKCMEISHPEIVFAQALLESGNFKSKLCVNYNNIFGMKFPNKRYTLAIGKIKHGYASYESWIQCLCDYMLWQHNLKNQEMTTNQYFKYLDKIYCEIPGYSKQLKNIIKRNKDLLNDN